MKRLYCTVEGQIEAAFVENVLIEHLAKFHVFVCRPRFTGLHGRRKFRIPRGGLLHTFRHALDDIRRWIKEDESTEARFTMMVDLYSLPSDFPGYSAAMKRPSAGFGTRTALAAELSDSRLVPYVQVHEFEAMVLADPGRLNSLYEGKQSQIERLSRACAAFSSPEEIDHGQHSHPKARIKDAVAEYDENVAGPLIAHDIGIEALRNRCPHFAQWLACLEQLDSTV